MKSDIPPTQADYKMKPSEIVDTSISDSFRNGQAEGIA